jgi:chaperone modulatory protein CbpM
MTTHQHREVERPARRGNTSNVRTRSAARSPDTRFPLVSVRRVNPNRMSLERVANLSGTHPQLVRRFVALGLVDASQDESGRLWFGPGAPATVARVQRLRMGLSLNYAAIGLVLDLLDRIEELEAALRRSRSTGMETTSWT